MNQTIPTVGVIIVSYNTSALLAQCLESLRTCILPLRILVVDNASTDESANVVRQRFPEVSLTVQEQNQGFATATNLGLMLLGFGEVAEHNPAARSPDFALLLNPDTVVHPGALETLVAFLQAHPRVGVVAPRLLNPDRSVQHAAFRFPTLMMSVLDAFPPGEVLPGRLYGSWWHGRYPQERTGHEPFPIDHPLGACMLVRQPVLAQVGLLDEGYFLYSEEVEWCWRIRRAGWAIWQVPQAQVTHIAGASTQQFRHRMLIQLHHSRIRFFQQHYSPGFLRAHCLIVQAGMLRLMLKSWYVCSRGCIGRDELRARLWAYSEISRLCTTSRKRYAIMSQTPSDI